MAAGQQHDPSSSAGASYGTDLGLHESQSATDLQLHDYRPCRRHMGACNTPLQPQPMGVSHELLPEPTLAALCSNTALGGCHSHNMHQVHSLTTAGLLCCLPLPTERSACWPHPHLQCKTGRHNMVGLWHGACGGCILLHLLHTRCSIHHEIVQMQVCIALLSAA